MDKLRRTLGGDEEEEQNMNSSVKLNINLWIF
jgi:hypothetical protein